MASKSPDCSKRETVADLRGTKDARPQSWSIFFNFMQLSGKNIKFSLNNYRPQRSCEGYVFTGVCLSTGGVCLSACWDTTPRNRPPREQTPPQQTSLADTSGRHPPGTPPVRPPGETATAADGTHPTRIHSCFYWVHRIQYGYQRHSTSGIRYFAGCFPLLCLDRYLFSKHQ